MTTKPRATLRYAQPKPKRPKRPSAAKRLRRTSKIVWMNGFILTGVLLATFAWWAQSSPGRVLNASLRDSCGAGELLIGVRGSGETSDQIGGLGEIVGSAHHRFSNNMRPLQVAGSSTDYMAVNVENLLTAKMYDQSYAHGRQQLYNTLYYWNKKCPDYRFVLAGYSQGADVLGSVVAELNPDSPVEARILSHIDAVALIADPRFNPSDKTLNASPAAKRTGLLTVMPSDHRGVRPAMPERLHDKVRSWCRADDPVCNFNAAKFAPCAAVIVSQTIGGKICADTVNKITSEHLQYLTDGTTEEIGGWMANKVKDRKLSPIGTNLRTASPAPETNTSPNPTSSSVPTQKPIINQPPDNSVAATPPPVPAPSPSPSAQVNRFAITSYDRMQPGAPHSGYFASAWQNVTAASNTITYLSTTVGNPDVSAGTTVDTTLTLRLCTTSNCSTVLAEAHPKITNYGETSADIGDVAVTPGATYYIVWYQPAAINGSTWVTYWWAGGATVSLSDQLQAAVRGYTR